MDHTDLITIVNPIVLASSPETVDKLEGLVGMWSKEIELVLAESEQVFSFVTYKGLVLILIYEKKARVWTSYSVYRQYTNLFIFRFVFQHIVRLPSHCHCHLPLPYAIAIVMYLALKDDTFSVHLSSGKRLMILGLQLN